MQSALVTSFDDGGASNAWLGTNGLKEGGAPPAQVDDGLEPDCPRYLLDTGVCDGQVLCHRDHALFDDPTRTGSNHKPGAPPGAPLFNGWPSHKTTVHQQMYYNWLVIPISTAFQTCPTTAPPISFRIKPIAMATVSASTWQYRRQNFIEM